MIIIDKIKTIINNMIRDQIIKHAMEIDHIQPKTCETCGCFINPVYAIKGQSVIMNHYVIGCCREYIHTPYYCTICDPQKLEKVKNETET